MFKKILLATDFSGPSRAALFASVTLAARCLARIDALHVVTYLEDVFYAPPYPIPDIVRNKEGNEHMKDFFPEKLYPNSHRQIVIGSSIVTEILKYAKEQHCDLIVAGTHGRHKLAKFLLGSVTTQLVRVSDVPVMVVREHKKADGQYQAFNRVLVPTDFSDASMRALEFGATFANFVNAELHLLHVVDVPGMNALQLGYSLPHVSISSSCELNVDHTLIKMLEKHELNTKPQFGTRFGDPVDEILRYAAERNCDFIVMGTHGRKGLERTLMGSVTATVVSNSHIPVFTILAQHNFPKKSDAFDAQTGIEKR